jgi:N-acetyl sugar amidotransferase
MTDRMICTRCVMDSSNPLISYDELGHCNCCSDAVRRMPFEWFRGADGRQRLDLLAARLKAEGRGKKYDAMIGLSGGVDSAYLAHLLRTDYDMRLLAVHVDGGWNTEPAVRNIEVLVKALKIDLHTHVIEWSEMRDLQLSFLKASVLNQDIPQDHAFFATLYRTARKFGLRHFLSGVNFSSESIIPPGWGYTSIDGRHVKALHSLFGRLPLKTFPIMGAFEYIWMTRVRCQLTIHRPLNFVDYDKQTAKQELISRYGYKDYGSKHSESRFTKFYQEVFLPKRYDFDKRRLHLSSQIVAGQVTREEALAELETPICDPNQARQDEKFVAKKLQVTVAELQELMARPPVEHTDYPNNAKIYRVGLSMKSLFRGRVRKTA